MATDHAIAATGEAILGLLEAARPKPEFANRYCQLGNVAEQCAKIAS